MGYLSNISFGENAFFISLFESRENAPAFVQIGNIMQSQNDILWKCDSVCFWGWSWSWKRSWHHRAKSYLESFWGAEAWRAKRKHESGGKTPKFSSTCGHGGQWRTGSGHCTFVELMLTHHILHLPWPTWLFCSVCFSSSPESRQKGTRVFVRPCHLSIEWFCCTGWRVVLFASPCNDTPYNLFLAWITNTLLFCAQVIPNTPWHDAVLARFKTVFSESQPNFGLFGLGEFILLRAIASSLFVPFWFCVGQQYTVSLLFLFLLQVCSVS